mmetsp:Transcript_17761/g.30071  ORF Transcript_17761/g.30071 Transcript_17761/m.30071 type:complete len:199 (-) Transcript_17761:22-618(-)
MLHSNLKACLNLKHPVLQELGVSLEIVLNLDVIQDANQDGNLFTPLSSAATDILLQIHRGFELKNEKGEVVLRGSDLVSSIFWRTLVLKVENKMLVDPQNQEEACLSNNLVGITCFFPLDAKRSLAGQEVQVEKITTHTDKGNTMLRTAVGGQIRAESFTQLEHQKSVLSLGELREIGVYVKNKLALSYFKTILTAHD